jgi:thermitase
MMYPLTFVIALITLTAWFYLRDKEQRGDFLRKLFYVSFAAFAVSWLLSKGDYSYKLVVLGRELLVLAVVPFVLGLFRRTKWAYIALLVAAFGLLKAFYFQHLKTTFPQVQQAEAPVFGELDKQGELLVEIKDELQISDVQEVLMKYELASRRAFFPKDADFTDLDDYYVLDVPLKFQSKMGEIIAALEATGSVDWVEANEQLTLSPIEAQRPTPKPDNKFGINDPGLQYLWGFNEMKVDDLYEVLKNRKPQKKALIAILDTGVDANHEDLKDNFTSTNPKYDSDKLGHGSHCAGIAAAVSNNGIGVASFSQTNAFVNVTSVKVLSDNGFGTQQGIINGMIEAADAGADVLSMSLGGFSTDRKQRAYQKAVEYANRKGGIVIAAAGNANRNARDFAPANAPGVIAVSAVDTLLGRASFSNFIQDVKMAVAAPGVKIYSTTPGNQYQTLNGTSMAAPYVSGLVGLMKSLKPGLTTEQVFQVLNKTGTETKNTKETGKLIQPGAAIRELMKS